MIEKNPENSQFKLELLSVEKKKIELSFTKEQISSDGGLLLLREVENQIGLIRSVANSITDTRDGRYINHTVQEMLTQRVFQIAAGYEDCNDCNDLRGDMIFKTCAGQLPHSGHDLASQPTMSRLENAVKTKDLYGIAKQLLTVFVASYASPPPVIILDCDDTNSRTYGNQQLSLFNQYYGGYCYMPLHIYEGLTGKLITTILKPGRRSKQTHVASLLKRIISELRQHWPQTKIIVRGDSHFCSSDFMQWNNNQPKVNLITGLSGNKKLHKLADVTIKSAQREYESTQKPQKRYHSFMYKADSWEHEMRVIVKVEVSSTGTNIRYIVTDLWDYKTKELYEKGYCARGAMELRIKEHKLYLKSDRASCSSFKANQFRLFLHSMAYILLHTLQTETLKGSEFATATFKTIQNKIIKTAAYVKELKSKIKIEFPRTCPVKDIQSKAFLLFAALRE